MLDTAERWLRKILAELKEEIEAGTPVIVLEPSCGAVFREELTNLLPHDQNAHRLRAQTFLLSEFLQKKAPHWRIPQLRRKALVHLHCHHRAVMGIGCEEDLLKRLGLDFRVLDSGCCGMAGAFGFEKGDHYDVSVKCGERVLLPSVRQAPADTLLITNGFSCHEQIRQLAGRQALHVAELAQLALKEGVLEQPTPATDEKNGEIEWLDVKRAAKWAVASACAAAAGMAGASLWKKRHHQTVHD
jgi:Fe-S oxidoreductase